MLIIILRLIHVVGGVVWVGFVAFVSFLLMPALGDAGPAGGKVMESLQKRGIVTIPPILALLTLLSGVWLLIHDNRASAGEFFRSRAGMAFSTGGLLAILAFIVGMSVLRPTMMKVTALMQGMASLSEAERPAAMAEVTRLRGRAQVTSRAVAHTLLLTTALMAVARYL